MSFYVFNLDAIFCATNFFKFQRSVASTVVLICHIFVPFINYTRLAIVSEANLHCGDFFSEKMCHKLVISTSFWSWLLSVFSASTSLNTRRRFFLGCKCVVDLLKIHESTNFLILYFMFSETCLFLWSSSMRVFDQNFFFLVQDIVWLVKSSWCSLLFYSSPLAKRSLQKRISAVVTFVRKKLSQIGSFH